MVDFFSFLVFKLHDWSHYCLFKFVYLIQLIKNKNTNSNKIISQLCKMKLNPCYVRAKRGKRYGKGIQILREWKWGNRRGGNIHRFCPSTAHGNRPSLLRFRLSIASLLISNHLKFCLIPLLCSIAIRCWIYACICGFLHCIHKLGLWCVFNCAVMLICKLWIFASNRVMHVIAITAGFVSACFLVGDTLILLT